MTKLTGGQGPKPVSFLGGGSQEAKNRPAMRPRVPGNILFHDAGPTGWDRIRQLGDYKGTKSESNFEHLHNQFTEEGA